MKRPRAFSTEPDHHRLYDASVRALHDQWTDYVGFLEAIVEAERAAKEEFWSDAIGLLTLERGRQVRVEGFTPEHDDAHTEGELAFAAGCYALGHGECHDPEEPPHPWPWAAEWWKPGDGSTEGRIRELVKAGALIVAEIDRLQRLQKGGEQ